MARLSRDQFNKARADFWRGKEEARRAGDDWIRRYGTDEERRELERRDNGE